MITIIILAVATLIAISEAITMSVYGLYLRDDQINPFMVKHYKEYMIREDGNLLYALGDLPGIWVHNGIFAKWCIEGQGQIPRWSFWHKELEFARKTKVQNIKKKTLSDY